jgi:nudix-type nucleoside diphosphatase (YffH/AdpP family)
LEVSMKILSVRLAHQGWLKLFVASVRTEAGAVVDREFIAPRPAVAVLPYDPVRKVALLVRQARPAVLFCGGPDRLLEAAAGQVDEGETAEAAARREALEELGLRLGGLEPVADAWTSPGPSSERIALFLAPYVAGDRIGEGGGVASEHEDLAVEEIALTDLNAQARAGEIVDLKTLALFFALYATHPALFVQETARRDA